MDSLSSHDIISLRIGKYLALKNQSNKPISSSNGSALLGGDLIY